MNLTFRKPTGFDSSLYTIAVQTETTKSVESGIDVTVYVYDHRGVDILHLGMETVYHDVIRNEALWVDECAHTARFIKEYS